MTRINCIPVKFLLDQHLLAEYNEIALALASLRRSKKTGRALPKKDNYTLNAGHVIFFYDKGAFLKRRYEALQIELKNRNYNLNDNRLMDWEVFDKPEMLQDWVPSLIDQQINVARIFERMMTKPSWYQYYRKPINLEEWWCNYTKWNYKIF